MTVRISKPSIDLRSKLSELERPIGVKGNELMRAETAQEARDLVSAGRKNLIINGGMDVWQRGTSFSNPASAGYTADRWKCSTDPTDISRSTDVPSGEPFTYSMLMAANGSGGTRHAALQGVELTATGNAGPFKVGTTWTFSCWMKGGANGSIIFGTEFRDDPNSGTNAVTISSTTFNYTTSWQKFTHTFTVGVSPGGTNLCLAIIFFAATAPANNLYLTGCQLEKGKNATEFEHRSYGEELALCQRYYEKSFPDDVAPARGTSTTSLLNGGQPTSTLDWYATFSAGTLATYHYFRVPKRGTPQMTLFGTSDNKCIFFDFGTKSLIYPGLIIDTPTKIGFRSYNNGSGLTNNSSWGLDVFNWTAEAEL